MPLSRRLEVAREVLLGREVMPPKEVMRALALIITTINTITINTITTIARLWLMPLPLVSRLVQLVAITKPATTKAIAIKVAKPANHRPSASLVLRTLGIPRSTWYYHRRKGMKEQDKAKNKAAARAKAEAEAKTKEQLETSLAVKQGAPGAGGLKTRLSDSSSNPN